MVLDFAVILGVLIFVVDRTNNEDNIEVTSGSFLESILLREPERTLLWGNQLRTFF